MKKGNPIASLNLINQGDVIIGIRKDSTEENVLLVHKIEYHTSKGTTSMEFIEIDDLLFHSRVTLMTACNSEYRFVAHPDETLDSSNFKFFKTGHTQEELVKVLLDHMSKED